MCQFYLVSFYSNDSFEESLYIFEDSYEVIALVFQAKNSSSYTVTLLFINDLIVKNYAKVQYYFQSLYVFSMPNFRILRPKHSVSSLEIGKSYISLKHYPVFFLKADVTWQNEQFIRLFN